MREVNNDYQSRCRSSTGGSFSRDMLFDPLFHLPGDNRLRRHGQHLIAGLLGKTQDSFVLHALCNIILPKHPLILKGTALP